MGIERAFINLTVTDLSASRSFYEQLGYAVRFASDWFVHLGPPGRDAVELGLLMRDGDVVPESARSVPSGVLLTVVVPDVDAVHASLAAAGAELIEPPRDLFYGQRRLVVRAPEGTLIDVSSPCEPDPGWMSRVRQQSDGSYVED
jgi:catechol 2,3-dioxygenase-like lactoylglutathione lyase family enzyme